MAKHALWCSHYGVDVPHLSEVICVVCGSSWPCPSWQAYTAEVHRRVEESKNKVPDRLVGRHKQS